MTHDARAKALQRYTYRPGVYDLTINDFRPGMEPNDQGDWVRYIDITAALCEVEHATWEQVINNLVLRGELRDTLYPLIDDPALRSMMKVYQDEADSIISWCRAQAGQGMEK